MVQVLSLTLFALLVARIVHAPRGTWRYIVGAAVAVLAGSQLLPAGHPFRADVAQSAGTLFWLGLGLVPVAAYAFGLRMLRRRSGVDLPDETVAHPAGLVQIADDAVLSAETHAALDAEAEAALGVGPETLSLGWRTADGTLAGHLRLRVAAKRGEIVALRVVPDHRGNGIGASLVTAAVHEAKARGALVLEVRIGDWQAPEFFGAMQFREIARRTGVNTVIWMERPVS